MARHCLFGYNTCPEPCFLHVGITEKGVEECFCRREYFPCCLKFACYESSGSGIA